MAKAERFEGLFVWQEARMLRNEVSRAAKARGFCHDFELRDQLGAAAPSAMDNIAEGFERGSNKEFAQFLIISKGSAGEVRSALYAAFDDEYITATEFGKLRDRALSVSGRCSRLNSYLQRSSSAPTRSDRPT